MAKVNVKGEVIDLLTPFYMLPERKKKIEAALHEPITSDPINDLARSIHPSKLHLVVKEVKDETVSTKTFRLVPAEGSTTKSLPAFRAGQYVSVKLDIDGVGVTRPYSVASSPTDALKGGFIELTIRKKDGGFATQYIWDNWKEGTAVETSGPCGNFYIDSLRDSRAILGIGGGCGVTPFRSMIREIIDNNLDVHFTLLYGTRKADDIIYKDEMLELERQHPDKLKVNFVCSEPDESWSGPTGLLTSECVMNLGGGVEGKTIFICGPQVMYNFLDEELKGLNIPRRRLHREAFGEAENVLTYPNYPKELADKEFEITVLIGEEEKKVPAKATETVVVSLERAGIAPPSQCRSGECGFCRSMLLSGDVFVSPENDGRRLADRKFGWFHPCSSYPVSDLKIRVARSV